MKLDTMQDLFVDQVLDLYSAESQIVKALPKMADAATTPDLQRGFHEHLEQTKTHVDRLRQICDDLNIPINGSSCKGMEGIIDEGKDFVSAKGDPVVRDAGLIAAAQRVEHYEISGYGTARTFANRLGYSKAAQLLEQTLTEEKQTDQKLTNLAEREVNQKAQSKY